MGAGASSSARLEQVLLQHRLQQLPPLVNRNECIEFIGAANWNQNFERLFNEYQTHSVVSKDQLLVILRATYQQAQSSSPVYQRVQKLGKGSFGVVYLVRRDTDDAIFVMKVVQMHDRKSSRARSRNQRKPSPELSSAALREAQFLCKLSHPNVVGFVDAFKRGEALCIVMSFCECGDLSRRIKAARKKGMHFREEQIMKWFIQLVLAIEYLHGQTPQPILHRDIKPDNIFLSHGGDFLKLGDFGVSKALASCTDQTDTRIGTPYYMSPEMFARDDAYGLKSDLWAVGVVLFELAKLQPPFCNKHIYQLAQQVTNAPVPSVRKHYSVDLDNMVFTLLQKQPQRRPSATKILNMPYVQVHLCGFRNSIARMIDAAPARLRLAAARSSGLKSFAGLISAHNARQQVRARQEQTQLLQCITQRVKSTDHPSPPSSMSKHNLGPTRLRLQPLQRAVKKITTLSPLPQKNKPALGRIRSRKQSQSQSGQPTVGEDTVWGDRQTLPNATEASSDLQSGWLTPEIYDPSGAKSQQHLGSNSDAGMRTNETDIQWPDRKETVGVATSTGPMTTLFASRKITVEDAGMRTNETDIRWPDRKETVGVVTSTGPMTTLFASRKITVEDAGMRTNETDIRWPDRKETVGVVTSTGPMATTFASRKITVKDAGMRTNETDIRWPDRKETVGVATSTGPMPTTFASRKITVEGPDYRTTTGGTVSMTEYSPKITVDVMTSTIADQSVRMTVHDQLLHSMKMATNGQMLKEEWMHRQQDDDDDDYLTNSDSDMEPQSVRTIVVADSDSSSENGTMVIVTDEEEPSVMKSELGISSDEEYKQKHI